MTRREACRGPPAIFYSDFYLVPTLRVIVLVILSESERFSVNASWLASLTPGSASKPIRLASDLALREKTMIESALREAQGKISGPTGAAAKLGLPRQTLESKIKRLGIKRYRFKIS
jgi:formate hydrogenlyase transcriptional activator